VARWTKPAHVRMPSSKVRCFTHSSYSAFLSQCILTPASPWVCPGCAPRDLPAAPQAQRTAGRGYPPTLPILGILLGKSVHRRHCKVGFLGQPVRRTSPLLQQLRDPPAHHASAFKGGPHSARSRSHRRSPGRWYHRPGAPTKAAYRGQD